MKTVPAPPALPGAVRDEQGTRLAPAGAGVRRHGVVVANDRRGLVLQADGRSWLIHGAAQALRRLGAGMSVQFELLRAGPGQARAAQLTAAGGQALQPPLRVRLVALAGVGERAATGASELVARLLGRDGTPARACFPVRLVSAPGAASHDDGLAAGPVPPVMSADVLGRDAQGRVLLRAGDLVLRLEDAVDLPPVARLSLAFPNGIPGPAPGGEERVPSAGLARAIREGSIRGADGGLLALPRPDETLAAGLLRLLRALGDQPAWGEGKARGGLLPDAGLEELARYAREPLPGGWRIVLLPFGLEENVEFLRMYLREPPPAGRDRERRGRGRGGEPGQEAPRRAVFEIGFSRLGRCQLDVLWRTGRCDLALRTARPLAAGLRREINGIFLAAREFAGLAGEMAFRPYDLLRLPEPATTARSFSATA